jgi:hypothetical protein
MRELLWGVAEEMGWERLSGIDKSTRYEVWTRDPEIGGRLTHFMDPRKVRVYIKDTLMKGFSRARLADHALIMRVLGLPQDGSGTVLKRYERPHGRLLATNLMVAWGQARDWKDILMALHERTFELPGVRPFAAILNSATGKFKEDAVCRMVQAAADKLGIEKVVWL